MIQIAGRDSWGVAVAAARRDENNRAAHRGYGEVGGIVAGRFEPVVRLGGWTRGPSFRGGFAVEGLDRAVTAGFPFTRPGATRIIRGAIHHRRADAAPLALSLRFIRSPRSRP